MNIPLWLRELGRLWPRPLFLVGGLVRNHLLGLAYGDNDLASALTPTQVLELLQGQEAYSVIPKKPELGTVEIHFHQEGQTYIAEHTTFRREVYFADGSHTPMSIAFSQSMEEDAFRRDFTVNALYVNIMTGEISDPTGGRADLNRRLLRATSSDPEIIMRDDALRILRLVRFGAALDFSIEPNTLAAAQKYAPGLGDISAERRREELFKLLLWDLPPYDRLQREQTENNLAKGLRLLWETGAWPYLLPVETFSEKNIRRCGEMPPDLLLRLTALLPEKELAQRALGREGLYQPRLLEGVEELLTAGVLQNAPREELLPYLALLSPERTEQAALLHGGAVAEAVHFLREHHAPRSRRELALSGEELIRLTGACGREISRWQEKLFVYAVLHPEHNTKEGLTAYLEAAAT